MSHVPFLILGFSHHSNSLLALSFSSSIFSLVVPSFFPSRTLSCQTPTPLGLPSKKKKKYSRSLLLLHPHSRGLPLLSTHSRALFLLCFYVSFASSFILAFIFLFQLLSASLTLVLIFPLTPTFQPSFSALSRPMHPSPLHALFLIFTLSLSSSFPGCLSRSLPRLSLLLSFFLFFSPASQFFDRPPSSPSFSRDPFPSSLPLSLSVRSLSAFSLLPPSLVFCPPSSRLLLVPSSSRLFSLLASVTLPLFLFFLFELPPALSFFTCFFFLLSLSFFLFASLDLCFLFSQLFPFSL